jgi:hypothetical protein
MPDAPDFEQIAKSLLGEVMGSAAGAYENTMRYDRTRV